MSPSSSLAAQLSEMSKAMLVAGLALVVASAVLLVSAEHELRRNNTEVQRSNAALLELAEINSLVIGVDFSARGYALTGEKLFADHENEKQLGLKLGLAELTRLADPEQADDIARLTRLIDRHAAVYAGFVKLGPGHAKEMAALIINPGERQKRYDVLAAMKSLRGTLMADLLHHQTLAEQQQRFTLILTFAIVAIAFLGSFLEVVVKTVFIRRRRRRFGTAIARN